ncbi:VENN motif pre-toxin domain-containing protein, partial [Escherichia coli]|uniref:VENN motif pre-toxin domain-containing protein n=1 Tax=Escherichia coli TaxID=562 RepID=UPI00201B0505
EAQVISQISGQMSNIVMTYGETEAMKAARKEHPGMSDAQLRETPEYREVMKGYGTGSTPQMVVQAITGVLGGLNAWNPGQVLAGGLNPAVAQLIKQSTGDNREANLMAHAVWGALAAQLGGNNAASGAAGAFSGELAARYIIDNYYGGRTDSLSEQERQQISMLATIASGIAGGLVGNSTSAAGMGAMAGKNAAENNSLSGWENLPKGLTDTGKAATSWVKYAQDHNLSPEQVQAGLTDIVRGNLPESADIIKAILENNPGSDTVMALLSAEDAKDYALALLTSIPAEKALSLVGKGLKVIDNKILISAAEKISTAKPGLQSAAPRDLNEQMFWKQVESNPSQGGKLPGMNNAPRFPISAGFQKMEATHYLPDGSSISVHYQYNVNTGKAYDMKIVTPQRNPLQPGPSLTDGGKK